MQARGDAAVEVNRASNVNLFGMKSEGNYCQLWLRHAIDVLFTGFVSAVDL